MALRRVNMESRYTYSEILNEVFSDISDLVSEGYFPCQDKLKGRVAGSIVALNLIEDGDSPKIESFLLTVSNLNKPKKITYNRTSSESYKSVVIFEKQEDDTYIIVSQETSYPNE